MAAMGSIPATPEPGSYPVGAFIHPFTLSTKSAEAAPESATTTPAARWAPREIRSHP